MNESQLIEARFIAAITNGGEGTRPHGPEAGLALSTAEPLPLLERPITFFTSKEKTIGTRQTLRWFVERLMGDGERDQIEAIRAADPATAKTLKGKLPAVVFGGYYASRKAGAAPVELSGLLSLDFDKVGERGALDLKAGLARDRHVVLAFISPGGEGVKAVIRFDGAATHGDAFSAVASHFEKKFKVKCDAACKDAVRLCFVSWDAAPVVNQQAVALAVFAERHTPLSSTTYNLHPTTLPPTTLHPTPYTLHPTPYNTEQGASDPVELVRAERAARKHLDELKAAGENAVAWCYEKLVLQRHPARRGKRNDWLLQVTPLLFRALSGPVAARLVEIGYDLSVGIWSDPKEDHMTSFGKLWSGCESNYPSELNAGEVAYYHEIDGPEKAAFRICRDLAAKNDGVFFIPSDHMRWRTQGNGWEILNRFQKHGLLKLVAPGQRREKGAHAKAATYRWLLGERKEAY